MKTRLRLLGVSIGRMLLAVALVAALTAGTLRPAVAATQIDIVGPAGSGAFGTSVTVLPNGNIVVTDPYYDAGTTQDVGAVYLYDGATGVLISALTGSTTGDIVGSYYDPYSSLIKPAVTVLSNGDYVVSSPYWDNGAVVDAGAVTWRSGTTGGSGVVSATNSLVGSTANDHVGAYADFAGSSFLPAVTALSNGNYVVASPAWDNGTVVDAGTVTWGSGATGVSGVVSAENSLVGSTAGDQIGCAYSYYGVTVLSNGNYVVTSPDWDNGPVVDAGAATWGSGMTGVSGFVSADNSLVGSTDGDQVGYYGVTALSNGNYVVGSLNWDNGTATGAGAVTWGSGTTGVRGVVSAANSLVGSKDGDSVGYDGVTELSNGHYVVVSHYWDKDAAVNVGAVTWGNGTTGIRGVVSEVNSLVGSTAYDRIGYVSAYGYDGMTALSNGNYVVVSDGWDNGAVVDAGAVTWGDGMTGVNGVVSADNSLVGSTHGDRIGYHGVTALSNGNYVVVSPAWDNGAAVDAGAATWGNGMTGITGPVSASNSLVGSTAHDAREHSVTALSNGNYVVSSPFWDNGTVVDAGAATWGDGMTGVNGVVSADNSLVGSTDDDRLGDDGVAALTNGNYVVASPAWDNGAVVNAGAATWGSGTTGIAGLVSADNSLLGSTANDFVGTAVAALNNGNYVVSSPSWSNGAGVDIGAATWGSGMTGVAGSLSADNSLVGSTDGREFRVVALSNGNYVVSSPYWDNGAAVDAGVVTWGSGTAGVRDVVSAANSLVGTTAADLVGDYHSVTALSNGNYVVSSPHWDNGATVDAGAVTWGNRIGGTCGSITAENSVLGTAEDGGWLMRWTYDKINRQLIVGRPADNMVTLFRLPLVYPVFLPVVLRNAP